MATYLVSGAGTGIGSAITKRLSEAGHSILLLGRTVETLQSTRAELSDPDRHAIIVADVRDGAAIATGLQQAGLESLDGIVANAGVGGANTYGKNDRWDEVLSINLTGTYVLVNECLPYLRRSRLTFKHIVLISSILAKLGVPNYSAYCAAKSGLLGLMRSWAVQFAIEKILINAVCPGWVETKMAKEGLQHSADATGSSYEDVFKRAMSDVLLGKMSTPDEIAHLIQFLVADNQTSITGQTFDINNGALMPA